MYPSLFVLCWPRRGAEPTLRAPRFRPWRGVFCSDEYLGSQAGALDFTRRLGEAYAELGVAPLVETVCFQPLSQYKRVLEY